MTQTMSIRIDSNVKKEMTKVCKQLGLSVSAAFNVFASAVAREKRIPFECAIDPFYSEENMKYLNKVIGDIKSGKAKMVEHDLIEVDQYEDAMV